MSAFFVDVRGDILPKYLKARGWKFIVSRKDGLDVYEHRTRLPYRVLIPHDGNMTAYELERFVTRKLDLPENDFEMWYLSQFKPK